MMLDRISTVVNGRASIPNCDKCGGVQTELGGIEFGPPRTFEGEAGQWCRKLHVCVKCTAAPNTKTTCIDNVRC